MHSRVSDALISFNCCMLQLYRLGLGEILVRPFQLVCLKGNKFLKQFLPFDIDFRIGPIHIIFLQI